jgi:hypothetical protein
VVANAGAGVSTGKGITSLDYPRISIISSLNMHLSLHFRTSTRTTTGLRPSFRLDKPQQHLFKPKDLCEAKGCVKIHR